MGSASLAASAKFSNMAAMVELNEFKAAVISCCARRNARHPPQDAFGSKADIGRAAEMVENGPKQILWSKASFGTSRREI